MSAHMTGAECHGRGRPWRWPLSVAVILPLHVAAVWLLEQTQVVERTLTPAEAVLIDLTPPAPPQAPPSPVTPPAAAQPTPPAPPPPQPAPPQPAPPPEPAPPIEAAPSPSPPPLPAMKPEVVLPRPPPRPVPPPRPRPPLVRPRVQPVTPAVPMTAEPSPVAPPVAAAPAPAAAPRMPSRPAAVPAANWASQLAAHLLRFRHYPPEAERRGMTGVVMMRFSVDAAGRIVSSSMVRSSGHDMLDEEAEAWLRRAAPLPPPPPDRVAPAQIVVPLNFVLN